MPTPEAARRRAAILDAVGFAATALLTADGTRDDRIDDVLARLGDAAGVSRVYVFQNVSAPGERVRATQRHEWVAPGAAAQDSNPLLIDLDYAAMGWRRWIDALGSGEPVHGPVAELPREEQAQLLATETVSIALMPIMVGPEWWGFIGFDDCDTPREWTAELTALRAAASTLSATIQRERTQSQLRERESRYLQIAEATSDGILLSDRNGNVVATNRAFCEMHATSVPEVLARPADSWIHPDDAARRDDERAAVATGTPFESTGLDLRADGSPVPVEVRGSSFLLHGERHVLRIVRDDTARTRAFSLLEQRVAALATIAGKLTVDHTLDEALQHVATCVTQASGAVAAAIHLLDDAGRLRVVACHGLPHGWPEALQASWDAGVDSPSTRALHRQELTVITDAPRIALANPGFAPLHPLLRTVEWSSLVVVPLDASRSKLGAMNVYFRAGDEPDDEGLRFLRAVADQGALAAENARLFADARAKAGLEERQRLARELHDSVSQALYGIALGAKTARTLADRDPSKIAEPLDYVLTLADAALAEMRSLIFELRPESLAEGGLVAALEKHAEALRARHGLHVTTAATSEPDVPFAAKEALYRVAQEATSNVVKHARATHVDLRLHTERAATVLEITDDGIGFATDRPFPGHLGLTSMRERVELLGGTLTVARRADGGTAVTATIHA
jgi:PAS domain S-box-containing protein